MSRLEPHLVERLEGVLARLTIERVEGNEAHADCPFCGKKALRGQTHFSVSLSRGVYKCFVCGAGGGVIDLERQVGSGDPSSFEMPVLEEERPEERPAWFGASWLEWSNRFDLADASWQQYAPLDVATIRRFGLRAGTLPGSRCRHRRLLLPIFSSGGLVCIRGRAIECGCKKWLASYGWKLNTIDRLYGLPEQETGVVFIVENPIDALLINLHSRYAAGATLSTGYWRDEWATDLQRASRVFVAFDNDLMGNGISNAALRTEMVDAWTFEHGKPPGAPAGIKLVNRLLDAGINAVLFPWPQSAPAGMDMRSWMIEEVR